MFKNKEQISIYLTSNCNLQCRYCYMPKMNIKKNDSIINFDFVIKGIEDFFIKSKSRCIRFFSSGEPTLEFNLMKKITDYARSKYSDVKFELETNGFFNNEICDWIEKNIDYLWISCDGEENIQKSNRPCKNDKEAFKVIYSNIRRYASSSLQFGVRATLYDVDSAFQIRMLDFFKKLGVKYVCASPVFSSQANTNVKTANLFEFAKGFVTAFDHALNNNQFYQCLMMVNFDKETNMFCQASIPTPRLTTDGYVSCCDWAAFGPEYYPGMMQECVYGKYNQTTKSIEYDIEKIKKIQKRNVSYLSENECRNCPALLHCAGGCIGKVMSQSGDLFKKYQPYCDAVLYLWENLKIPDDYIPVLHP